MIVVVVVVIIVIVIFIYLFNVMSNFISTILVNYGKKIVVSFQFHIGAIFKCSNVLDINFLP